MAWSVAELTEVEWVFEMAEKVPLLVVRTWRGEGEEGTERGEEGGRRRSSVGRAGADGRGRISSSDAEIALLLSIDTRDILL